MLLAVYLPYYPFYCYFREYSFYLKFAVKQCAALCWQQPHTSVFIVTPDCVIFSCA